MLLVTFSVDGGDPKPGALVGDEIVDLSAHAADLTALFGAALPPLDGPRLARADVRLHAPFRPGKIVGSLAGVQDRQVVEQAARDAR